MEVATKKINAAQEEWYKNGELELVDTYQVIHRAHRRNACKGIHYDT